MTKEQELREIIDKFEELGDVIGSAVVRRDGLMIISGLPSEINSNAVAAMLAAMVGTGETVSRELEIGTLKQVVVESKKGKLVSVGAGEDAIFGALVREKANMGLILMELERSAKRIEKII